MQCMEAEVERTPAEESAKPFQEIASASTRDGKSQGGLHGRKSWNSAALLAVSAALTTFAGLAWLYYYAVTAVQSTLSVFKP